MLLVQRLQISCDFLYLLLNTVSPSVPCSEKFELVCIKLCEVKSFVLFSDRYVVEGSHLLVFSRCDYRFQIHIHPVVTREKQLLELIKVEITGSTIKFYTRLQSECFFKIGSNA